MRTAVAILAAVFALPPAVAAEESEDAVFARIDALHGDPAGFVEFSNAVIAAVGEGERAVVARLMEYPLTVEANGETYDVPDAERFVQDYETFLGPELQTDLVDWTLGDSLVTSDGVGILDGRMWFANACDDADCISAHWIVTRIVNE